MQTLSKFDISTPFTLIEILVITAVGFTAATVAIPLVRQTNVHIRSRHQMIDQYQQASVVRQRWRSFINGTVDTDWQIAADGSFHAGDHWSTCAGGHLRFHDGGRTRTVPLPDGAESIVTIESSPTGLVAVLRLTWSDPDPRLQREHGVRIVASGRSGLTTTGGQ